MEILEIGISELSEMRIFIGIQLPFRLQNKIILWQKNYQKTLSPSGMRFIKPENLHVTIVPPWLVGTREETIHLLEQQTLGSAFTMQFDTIRFMPSDRPKFVWVYGSTPENLLQLRQNIAMVLQRPLEKRKYALHTTIARMQDKAAFVPVTEHIHWSISIKKFALFQSHLSSQGAEYEVVKEFELQQ